MHNLKSIGLLFALILMPLVSLTHAADYTKSNLPEGAIIRLGKGDVRDVKYSPDGTLLAVASSIGIWLYNAHTYDEIGLLAGFISLGNSMSFSPDSRILASGSYKTIKLWDVASGRTIKTLTGHSSWVSPVSFSPDGRTLASSSKDGKIKLWDVASGRTIKTLTGHSDRVYSVSFSPDGGVLASGSLDDGKIKLWDVGSGQIIKTLTGHSMWVKSVSFSPDGRTLASGSQGEVKMWDVASGRTIKTLKVHSGYAQSVSFSPDGRTLASGNANKTVKMWDVASGRTIKTLTGHSDRVYSVSFSPDGRTLASGSQGEVKMWDVASRREITTLTGYTSMVESVSFSPDGRTLASGSQDNTIKLWDVGSGQIIKTLTGHTQEVCSVSFSPDGRTLASGCGDGKIKMWDVASGRTIKTLKGHTGYSDVYSVSFSPDGRTLASGSRDNTIKLWDVGSGREIVMLTGHGRDVRSVSFSPDGGVLASGSYKMVKIWDVSSGRVLKTLTGHSGSVSSVSFSPDGRMLASGSWDETVKLWDVSSGREINTLVHSSVSHRLAFGVRSVSFSPDGRTLASSSDDGKIKLWDVGSGQIIKTLTGHSRVESVSFSPDGRTLASGSYDGMIYLWDTSYIDIGSPITIRSPQHKSQPQVTSRSLSKEQSPRPKVTPQVTNRTPSKPGQQASSKPKPQLTNRSSSKSKQQVTPALPPILSIEEITFSEGVLDAEETATLKIRIKNVGPGDAQKLIVELSGGLQELSFPRSTNVPTIPKEGGEKTVEIGIRGGFDLPTSTSTLDIRVIEPQFKQKVQGKRLRFETRKFQNPELVLADATVVESRSASPNNRIDLNEMIDLKFYVQNRGIGVAENVAVEVAINQAGVQFLGIGSQYTQAEPIFSRIEAGKYELVTYTYFVNSEFTASELRFKISTTERRGQYGFVQTKAVGINTELEQLGTLANLPRDDDRPAQRVQIEDLPDLEIDVRKDIPKTAMANPKAVAVVIGNRNYTYRDVPDVEFAHNDALIVKEYLIRTLGYKSENVLYYQDASKGTFESVFGSVGSHKGQLFNYVDPRGASDIFIYYSGHGAPDVKSPRNEKPSYLVPVDANPSNVAFGGYPVDLLYRNLKQTPYRHATVVIDACFSGTSAGGALIGDISGLGLPTLDIPRISQEKSAIFTATGSQQVANWYRDKQHGLFTYFFLKALRGESDRNGDGVLTAVEIQAYVSDHVLSTSRRKNSRDQNPQLIGNQQAVIVRY